MHKESATWGMEPDPLLERLASRARILLEAERTALTIQAEQSRSDVAEELLSNQRQTILHFEQTCADLREAAKSAQRIQKGVESELVDLRAKLRAAEISAQRAESELVEFRTGFLAEEVSHKATTAALAAFEAKLADLHASTSWKITAPLRFLRRIFGS